MRIFGVILAGGAGRRMGGADKALIQFGGETLLAQSIARLHPQVESLAISYNGASLVTEFPILRDAARLGPLSGILAAMDWAQGADAVVSVAVDTPHFPCDLVPRLHLAGDGGLAVARAARVHPTFGLWPLSLRGALKEFLASGVNPKVLDFCMAQGAAFADFPNEAAFANINTPLDLAALERE